MEKNRKTGAMELEYVVKMGILVLFFAIMAKLMYNMYWDTSNQIDAVVPDNRENTKGAIEVRSTQPFTTNQIKNYVYSCWSMTGEDYQEDKICYVLEGDFSSVDPAQVENTPGVPQGHVDVSGFDTSKTVAIIKFVDIGNNITLESLG